MWIVLWLYQKKRFYDNYIIFYIDFIGKKIQGVGG